MKLELEIVRTVTLENKNYKVDIYRTFVVVTSKRKPRKEVFCYSSGEIKVRSLE